MKLRYFLLGAVTTVCLLTLLGALGMPTGAEIIEDVFGNFSVFVYTAVGLILAAAVVITFKSGGKEDE
ncbi:hypothetical protein [Alteribacter natronophilus]|uniref:hypothetical protein n=1 Tax=Alteribacter natronophilus TaxID=2583810 RepID=UPI00110E7809|nr:hypothetical protein [Alteribacter natronophilus]TMW72884.1 hypothetical protein FGB90_00800 [Alteribacter natronophilus]